MGKPSPSHISTIVSGLIVTLSLALGASSALGAPVLEMQFSETGCGFSCPTPVTYTDRGNGILQLPTNTVFGGFKINGGQTTGFVYANGATPNSPNSDILDPGGNILISSSSTVSLTIKLTETGLVSQGNSKIGLYFDPGLTMSPGSTMTVATYADATDAAFGTATRIDLTASSVPSNVTYSNNANGSVTFVNGDPSHQKTPQADSGSFIPVAMSSAGDFSITEVVTLTGPISSTQARLSGSFSANPPAYAPEPGTIAILATGFAGLGVSRFKRHHKLFCSGFGSKVYAKWVTPTRSRQ
jgi:hypothetical protein